MERQGERIGLHDGAGEEILRLGRDDVGTHGHRTCGNIIHD